MAYQLSDLVTEVQTKVKDQSFNSTLIAYYLSDIQREVLGKRIFSFMEDVETPTLSINDTTHAYPSDLQVTLEARLNDPSSSTTYYTPEYLPHRQFFDRYPDVSAFSSGAPVHFTDYGRTLNWSSKLDRAYNLTLRYIKKPTDLVSNTDVPSIPEEFKEILIRGAQAGVEEYRDNYDMAAIHRRKVEDLAEDMVMRYSSRSLLRTSKATTRGR